MKRKIYSLAVALGVIVASCGSPEKMKDAADQIKATCTPTVLEAKAGVIKASINVSFPEKYFHPSAVLEMLPVVKYAGGEALGEVKMLQGEKVKDNNTVIAAAGGSYTQEVTFSYTDAMKVATLEIRATLIDKKGNRLQFPADIKVADGVIATYKLAEVEVKPVYFDDSYQKSTTETKEAQVLFPINNSSVRPAELSKADVKLLQQFIADALPKEPAKPARGKKVVVDTTPSTKTLKGLEISSYASPDGEMDLNEKLSNNRGNSTDAALAKFFKQSKVKMDKNLVNIKHTAEDWEGFQQLMANSEIQDKELVLRVLSMYSDPAVREREIKNISAVYTVIAYKVLPQLRRSKLSATVEVANLNDEQIKAFVSANNLDTLDVEQLMYAAVKLYTEDAAMQETLYKKVTEKFNDVRGFNNLGALYLSQDKLDEAKTALDAALAIKEDAKIKNNLGYVLLKQGKNDEAEKQLAAAGLDESKAGMAYIALGKGEYSQAVTLLSGSGSFNEALALLLSERADDAKAVLEKLDTPKAYYLKAVIGARKNAEAEVTENLDKAGDLKANAKQDAEFVAFWPKL
ncbi:MAG: tetratricopeptide repeat protein [Prevotellaceae bacterium]|jgi:tetratricopeptide (TPR) repeat protein|nr:tetratricopeptide repeat protein [Prevotellaceae bacterium]